MRDRKANECPLHKVTIAGNFVVAKFEVISDEWKARVNARVCRNTMGWSSYGQFFGISTDCEQDLRQCTNWDGRMHHLNGRSVSRITGKTPNPRLWHVQEDRGDRHNHLD